MAPPDKKRYYSLKNLFSYLDSRRQDFPGNGENFAIIIYIGDYFNKEKGSEARLIAVCESIRAAHYIARIYKQQEGLNFLPVIRRTVVGLYPETSHVEAHLAKLEGEFEFLHKREQESSNS